MKRVTNSDEFMRAYDQYKDAIFRHCYFRISDRERACDLVQDTFVRAWQYVIHGREIDNPKAFLYQIADNLIIDEYRKKKSVSLDMLVDEGFEPGKSEHEFHRTQFDVKRVIDTLSNLSEKDREVIVMRYIDELSPKEIANILHETENVVSVRIHRAIKKVHEILKKQGI